MVEANRGVRALPVEPCRATWRHCNGTHASLRSRLRSEPPNQDASMAVFGAARSR